MSHGSVAAAELTRSSCAKFFPKSKDKIPVLYWLNLASTPWSRHVGVWCCGCCWLRLSVLLYWLIPLLPTGVSARVVASLTWVCQKCHRLVQPFSITGSFWQTRVREWRLGWYSSRREGGDTCRRGKGHRAELLGAETSSPSSAGVGRALWTMSLQQQRTCILEAESGIRACAEVSVLEGFYNPSVNWNGQFQTCCCPSSFYMQGLCTGSKVDAWSSAPEMQHLEIGEHWRSLV